MNYRIQGGVPLSGTVTTNVSKNAAVALLAASLLNRGTTTLRKMPRIEEVNRIIEVMRSMGVVIEWSEDGAPGQGDMRIIPPATLDLSHIDAEAASKTRAIAMFAAPLAHLFRSFDLPAPRGCDLGKRSLGSHVDALARLGITLRGDEEQHTYHVESRDKHPATIVMYEASDTGTENVLMAAAKVPGTSVIKFASANYMVQDLCFFLEKCGVTIEGIGTSTMVVHGVVDINADIDYSPSEDPIESMFFIALAATTHSSLTIDRAPVDFLELELLTLESMGLQYSRGPEYLADNGRTRLADITVENGSLHAPPEKIAARPYPGINIDNLPYFVPIATQADGATMIHDWTYDGRARHYMEMVKIGARMEMLDPHRVLVRGPVTLRAADVEAPPALRPATLLLIGMIAAKGESVLRNVYPINRGYAALAQRLKEIGANVEEVA